MKNTDRILSIHLFERSFDYGNNENYRKSRKKIHLRQDDHQHTRQSGLELNQIKLNNHSVSTRHYDNKPYIQAERGIEIEAAFDMKLINHLTDLIQTNHYNADIRTGFSVSDLAGIHRQLIEEAFKDSRKKAEIIAALDDYLSDYQIGESEFVSRKKASLASDQLSATDMEESETVTVIWILE